jgi:ribosome biogenesis protein SSF1/2
LRKQRREEQERNVKLKKQLAKEKVEDNDEPEEDEGDDGDDEGVWNDDEEISEGESDNDLASQSSESETEQPTRIPPPKRQKR